MKHPLLLLALSAMLSCLASSCNDDCCTLSVNKVCADDNICSGHASWEECRAYLEGLGYQCD